MVGTEEQARRALICGADGLIAQGCEAGGHITGDTPALTLAAGAAGVVAGTRFLLTDQARAHPEYQCRILAADKTFRTTLFGLGWNSPHRVVANAATRRWCHDDGRAKLAPRMINACSGVLAKLPEQSGCPTRRWSALRCMRVRPCCA
jgi:NAD(P)H-dependent flavin oxidoreductase YrpB (nitropropane dioxygenase family)